MAPLFPSRRGVVEDQVSHRRSGSTLGSVFSLLERENLILDPGGVGSVAESKRIRPDHVNEIWQNQLVNTGSYRSALGSIFSLRSICSGSDVFLVSHLIRLDPPPLDARSLPKISPSEPKEVNLFPKIWGKSATFRQPEVYSQIYSHNIKNIFLKIEVNGGKTSLNRPDFHAYIENFSTSTKSSPPLPANTFPGTPRKTAPVRMSLEPSNF
jgi:hypothetical protein